MTSEADLIPDEDASALVPAPAQRQWLNWIAIAWLIAIAVLVTVHPTLRTIARDTWQEMWAVNSVLLLGVAALKIVQALLSALTWRNAMGAAWPENRLSFPFLLGVDSGQDALNTFSPGRAGTWAMLAVFTLAIPGARLATMVAVWGVQSLAFWFFAMVNYVVIAIGLPQRTQTGEEWYTQIADVATGRAWVSGLIVLVLVPLLAAAGYFGRQALLRIERQVQDGLVILKTPGRFLRLIFLPSALAYVARALSCALLLYAFNIPVSAWTVVLALASRAASGAVRFAPGGIGTTQALEVVALRDYGSVEAVIAYSLVDLALTTLVNLLLAIPCLISVRGWRGARLVTNAPG